MGNLSLRHVYKVYSNGCKAVSDFNLEIENNEFVVFVGPSGCGKSTTLRMIAGLEEISAGELYIDGQLMNNVEPKDRDISMVFQNYALYPHMTVYDNMAFGLRLRHVPQEEIHKKVLWAAQVLKLTDYLDRKPRAMSGGQRQRVALGRAILRNPRVFLLDEPLSNLDAKLRTEMRAEITKLHQTLGTTFIYVTHDQVEAMTLGTKVVVMKLGFVQQVDTPQNLYSYPTNKFVAGFIGTPQMNFFEAKLLKKNDNVEIKFEYCDAKFVVDFNSLVGVRPLYLKGKEKVCIGLRCENISIDPTIVSKSKNKAKVKVSHFEDLGSELLVYCDLNMQGDGFEATSTRVIIKSYKKDLNLKPGDVIDAAFDMNAAHFFDAKTEETIKPRIPKENVFDCEIKNNSVIFLKQKIVLPPAIRHEDVKDAELFVPTDGINFSGNIPAEIIDVKNIDKKQIVYLKTDGRVFFAITDKKVEVGKKIKVGFDVTRISVKKEDETLIDSLPIVNKFVGTVTNLQNEKVAVRSIVNYYSKIAKEEIAKLEHEKNIKLGELGLNDKILLDYKKEYKEFVSREKAETIVKIHENDYSKSRAKKEKEALKVKLSNAEKEYVAKCNKFKEEMSKKVKNEETINKGKTIEAQYAKIENGIKEKLTQMTKLYIDGIELNKKYTTNCDKEDREILKVKLAEVDKVWKEKLAPVQLKLSNTTDKNEKMKILDELKSLKLRYEEERSETISQYKTFFADVLGSYLKLDPFITKKIVQALGISLFNVQYRFEIGLDSLKVVDKIDEGRVGIKLVVDKFLDYGNRKFVYGLINNERKIISVSKQYKTGDVILLDYDLEHISVYENKLDIRLY